MLHRDVVKGWFNKIRCLAWCPESNTHSVIQYWGFYYTIIQTFRCLSIPFSRPRWLLTSWLLPSYLSLICQRLVHILSFLWKVGPPGLPHLGITLLWQSARLIEHSVVYCFVCHIHFAIHIVASKLRCVLPEAKVIVLYPSLTWWSIYSQSESH